LGLVDIGLVFVWEGLIGAWNVKECVVVRFGWVYTWDCEWLVWVCWLVFWIGGTLKWVW